MPTVFVTGANRGLGFEHVKQYAEKKWEIIACSRNPEQSTELLLLKDQYPETIAIEKLDVTNYEEITALSKKYAEKSIDILINNAGIALPAPLELTSESDFMDHFSINVMGALNCIQIFLPLLKAPMTTSKPHQIINIFNMSSIK